MIRCLVSVKVKVFTEVLGGLKSNIHLPRVLIFYAQKHQLTKNESVSIDLYTKRTCWGRKILTEELYASFLN